MKFYLDTSKYFDHPDHGKKFKEIGDLLGSECAAHPTPFQHIFSGLRYINEDGVFIVINDLQDLMYLIKDYGSIIIDHDSIEICNDKDLLERLEAIRRVFPPPT